MALPRRFVASFLSLALLAALSATGRARAKNLLTADGPAGDTYELIRTAYTTEVPDCGHMVPHITEEDDVELGKYVFVFHSHVNEDDDRCSATDRQRTEIRARAADIVASEGETVYYAWKFKLDAGFQGAPSFTHIFQLKSDEAAPVMTLTPRVSTLAIDGRIGQHGATELSKFLGVWVRVDLSILFADAGELSMTIRRVSDGEVLFDYAGEADTWDADASAHDSKFGIYRSLDNRDQLRDEQVRFADFCASKQSASECADVSQPGGGGTGGTGGAVSGGGAGSGGASSGSGNIGGSGSPTAGGGAGAAAAGESGGLPAAAGTLSGLPPNPDTPATADTDADTAACACRIPGAARSSANAAAVAILLAAAGSSLCRRRRPPA